MITAAKDHPGKGNLLGPGASVLSTVLFGTMPFMAKTAFRLGSNAYTTAFGRFSTGAVVSLLLILILPKESLRVSIAQLRTLLLLALFYAATPVLLYSSYTRIDSGLASTLHFTYPVAVMLLSVLFLKERIGTRQALCAGICTLGILLLYQPGAHMDPSGMAIAALSGIVYAGYIVALGKSGLKGLSVLKLTFWLSFLSALYIFVFSLVSGNLVLALPAQVWVPYTGLGVFATVLALALFQIGVFLCGPVKASLLSTFEPLTGILIGAILYHEALSLRTCLGIGAILGAVVLLALPDRFLRRMEPRGDTKEQEATNHDR